MNFVSALLSPGDGYDTSTSLLFNSSPWAMEETMHFSIPKKLASRLLQKFVRWDAIYFSSIAERGYLYEQEWAFAWGFTRSTSFLAHCQSPSIARPCKALTGSVLVQNPSLQMQAISAMIIANSSHLLSVFVLYSLSRRLVDGPDSEKLSLVCATLHVAAPAGLFMCAPYAESLFSFLHFTGLLLYCRANESRRDVSDVFTVAAGFLIGLSSTVRSNGLFTGVIFVIDLISATLPGSSLDLRRIFALIVGGSLIGVGFILPQGIAYRQFCSRYDALEESRPWCGALVPSIYTFVQSHYW